MNRWKEDPNLIEDELGYISNAEECAVNQMASKVVSGTRCEERMWRMLRESS